MSNIAHMSDAELMGELERGGRLVVFEYCFSIIIMTFKQSSDIMLIRAGEGTAGKSLPYTLLTLFVGWWGFPWGPIYSFMALATNLSGGRDVTQEVLYGGGDEEY